jgi:glycosyltransferase involved in cell wall biosynthesis
LLIAGTGDLQMALAEEARQLGVADRVRFLGLRLDVPELLQIFDVYALPSVSEGMPMSLIEAMAAGCAIVATNVGGIGTMIQSEESGLLVPPRSPDALGAAIRRLLTDRVLCDRLGRSARDVAHAQFSARAMTRRYESFYFREEDGPVMDARCGE